MSAQSHRSDPRILGRRTLERDHRYLAALLRPGLSVLDIGCGTGAITAGIARVVAPHGRVVGIDRDQSLLEIARSEHAEIANLRFERGDAKELAFRAEFDIVNAARMLQWVDEPSRVIPRMKQSAKPSGMLVALDYNHTANAWEPDPPAEFKRFYNAFLAWRHANRWDNEMADHLPDLFRAAGLTGVKSQAQGEIVRRGDPGFTDRTAIWTEVIETMGGQLAAGGFISEPLLAEAHRCYDAWTKTELVKQTLALRAVSGMAP